MRTASSFTKTSVATGQVLPIICHSATDDYNVATLSDYASVITLVPLRELLLRLLLPCLFLGVAMAARRPYATTPCSALSPPIHRPVLFPPSFRTSFGPYSSSLLLRPSSRPSFIASMLCYYKWQVLPAILRMSFGMCCKRRRRRQICKR